MLYGALTVTALVLAIFLLERIVPGDPARNIAGPTASAEDVEHIRDSLGLNDPLPSQVGSFVSRIARGDLGTSIRTGRPTWTEISQRAPRTLILAGSALAVAVLGALAMALVSTVYRSRWLDSTIDMISVLSYGTPVFWVAIVAQDVFSVRLDLLPTSGYGGLQHLVLPMLVLAFFFVGPIVQLLRGSLSDVMTEDYIEMARAKGVGEWRVVTRHALKNALIPTLAFIGTQAGLLFGGAAITETVFAWQGLGMLVVTAAVSRDYPLLEGLVLVIGLAFVVINSLIEGTYGWLDPRIQAKRDEPMSTLT